jgi:hypothetical protein
MLKSVMAPPAAGTFSVQYRLPSTLRRSPKLMPPAATACALKGEDHAPKGAITGAGALRVGELIAAKPSAMPPMIAPAMKLDRRMLLMWGSKIAYRMLRGSNDGHT